MASGSPILEKGSTTCSEGVLSPLEQVSREGWLPAQTNKNNKLETMQKHHTYFSVISSPVSCFQLDPQQHCSSAEAFGLMLIIKDY